MKSDVTAAAVPFFNYPAVYRELRSDMDRAIGDVLNRGAYILQSEVAEFEAQLAKYLRIAHVVGVANCTDGLQLALDGCGCWPGP